MSKFICGHCGIETNYILCHKCGHYCDRQTSMEPVIYHDGRGGFITATKETIDHPDHYNDGKYEVIDVIEDWRLGFNLGNALKYIARADHKGKKHEDLEKAIWYLQRELGGNKK